MIQQLLFPETVGIENFDVTKTDLTLGTLVDDYRKNEALAFESEKKYTFSNSNLQIAK
jgi:hypothetical protein